MWNREWVSHSFVFWEMLERNSGKVYELAEEVARSQGLEVDDIELLGEGRRRLLRITIDRSGGVSIDDCESFSRDFGALMDVEDPIEGAYTLEVTSPGLDRPLKRLDHYTKNVGKLAKVILIEKMERQNVIVGRIVSADQKQVALNVDGQEMVIPFSNIKKARLEVEL